MNCPKCQFENEAGKKFCTECGAALALKCPHCTADVKETEKFCGECGQSLKVHGTAPPPDYAAPASYTPKHLTEKILTTRSAKEGERKLVTVLFADVANYTAMSSKLDPEDVHRIMDGCFQILMNEIHRYEGTINQFTGDGVMALFGAPVAHEDHAQRACRAALAIQKELAAYGEKIRREHGAEFRMRIGLNTGPVIVGAIGDDLRMDYTAVGDTTNLAARVQQSAQPGEVWMSSATRALVRDYLSEEGAGEVTLKGKSGPQKLYRLLSVRAGVRTRFDAGLVRGVTEFVGREPEMEALRSAYTRAKSGEAELVDIVGEAGVGKSRLVYEFRRTLGDEATVLIGTCLHYGRTIDFHPVIEIVRRAFGVEEGMSESDASSRVQAVAADGLAPFLGFYQNLLSLPVTDPKFNALNPEGRKFGTFEAVKSLLASLSETKPLLLLLEDVHWIDKISEELLTYVSRSVLDRPILLLATYRPEASPTWAQGAHYQRLGLQTLTAEVGAKLVQNLLGGLPIEPALEKRIVEHAGGNPFFVEEILRELLERGDLVQQGDRYACTKPMEQCHIPGTVQGVLAARLDRLGEDLKRTLQVASVIGRDFAFKLLKTILELGDDLRNHLTNLVGLEILYEKALYPELEYIFKHALTQEVAYESLLKQRRRELHGRIARTMEELYAEKLEPHYELLAHHYERSGQSKKALDYLILAGEKASDNGAIETAHRFFSRAYQLKEEKNIDMTPRKEARLSLELAHVNTNIGNHPIATDLGFQVISFARKHGLADEEKAGLKAVRYLLLEKRDERTQFVENAISRAADLGDEKLMNYFRLQSGVLKAVFGLPAEGRRIVVEAERVAGESGDVETAFSARINRSYIERWLGRPRLCLELTEGFDATLDNRFMIGSLSFVDGMRGTALAEVGKIEEAIDLIERSVDMCERFGAFSDIDKLYNMFGYCYGEIHEIKQAKNFNSKSEEIARKRMNELPTVNRYSTEVAAQACINISENLYDQQETEEAWKRLESLKQESKGEDYDLNRHIWETRMNYLMAQILLDRNLNDEAEAVISNNLELVQRLQLKKREGCFLRLLGEIQARRQEYENAINTMRVAIRILEQVGNPRKLWELHASLASVCSRSQRSGEANDQWRAAAEVVRRVASGISDRELAEGFLRAKAIAEILSRAES